MFALALGASAYLCTSYVFFKYPQLIHKKKYPKVICRNICHRGGSYENVENTIDAFENSLQTGSDMIELDCHITKDGKVVVVHENNLKRLTGVDRTIAETNYNDLPNLLPLKCKDDVNLITINKQYKIPLLEDVFKRFPNIPINIDIKIHNTQLINQVAYLITKYQREDITLWGSFQDKIEKECYKCNPDIPLYFSLYRVTVLVGLYYTGILPFIPLKESYLEIPVPRAVLKQNHGNANSFPLSKRFLMILADKFMLKRSFIKHLERRGILTYLWTLNDESDFELAFETLGVAGVMTDCPTKLKRYLENHPNIGPISSTKKE